MGETSYLFENPLVEELLQLLVTVVDAELLEAVHLEVLCTQKCNKLMHAKIRTETTSKLRRYMYIYM